MASLYVYSNRHRRLLWGFAWQRRVLLGAGLHFCVLEPLTGWADAYTHDRRTKVDWAEEIRWLLCDAYPRAKKVRLVSDNLNTHVISLLYEAFPAPEARVLAKRLEMHHTSKHGGWLNIAEIYI